MAGPLIWNGNFSRNLTSDILLPGSTYNDLLVGKQIAFNSSTGIVSGGILTINADPTKFDLTAGVGYITNYTAPNAPTYKPITWNAFTAQTTLGLTTTDTTYIMIDNTGAIFQLNTYPTAGQRRANIFVGLLTHAGHTVNTYGVNSPDFSASSSSQVYDFFDALGPFNINGNVVSTNGANLQIQKSSGNLFFRGYNYATDINNPHNVSITANAPITMLRGLQSGGALGVFGVVDPANYDVAGVLTAIPGPNATATIQRVFLAPNNVVLVQYGQALYNNITTAIASIGIDPFVVNPVLPGKSILLAYVIAQKNCTDLTNTAQAAILPAPRFAVGAGGGVNQVLSLQQSYNASVQPQIVLDATHGGLQFYDNATPLGTDLLTVANSTGATKYLNVTAAALSTTLPISTTNATASTTTATGALIVTGGAGIGGSANIGGAANITGTATAGQIIDSGLTADTAVYSNASKQLTSSATTTAQLGFLSTLNSNVQTQIDTKMGFNLIPDPLFASLTVAQWSKGITGTLTNGLPTGTPTFGSGSSGNLTLSAVTSGQIQGTASMSLASSATNVAGDMIATGAIAIDPEYRAKVLGVKFAYQMISGTGNFSGTSSNSWAWAVYDVTNSAWIATAGQFNLVQSSGSGLCTGTFQVPSTTASIRFVIYNVTATTGATTIYFDDFYTGPQVTAQAPAMSDESAPVATTWTATTTPPTKGTIVNDQITWRRIGQYARIKAGYRQSTAPGAGSGTYFLAMPAGLVIDTAIWPVISAGYNLRGQGFVSDNATIDEELFCYPNSSTTLGFLRYTGTAVGNFASSSTPNFGNANLAFEIEVDVPISGWSSNSVSSADTDTRVVEFTATASGQTPGAVAGTTAFTLTSVQDTHGAFNGTNTYTIPVSGLYSFQWNGNLGAFTGAVNNQVNANIIRNGSATYLFQNTTAIQTASALSHFFIATSGIKLLSAGDLITVNLTTNAGTPGTTASGTLSISRLSGPAVVTATESVNGRYFSSSTAITGSDATITYATKDFDSHNAYASGTMTVPVSGKFQFNAALQISGTYALNQAASIAIYKNGSVISQTAQVSGGAETSVFVIITDLVSCLAGDLITVRANSTATSPSINASNSRNFFSWSRSGN